MNQRGDKLSRGLPATMDGGALRAAQIVWLFWTALLVLLVLWGLVLAYQDPSLVEMPPLTDLFVGLGLDFRLMITLILAVPFVIATVVSVFIFAKRSSDPMAQLFAAALVTTYALASRALVALEGIPVVGVSSDVVFGVGAILAMLVFGLFPSGRFEPRWSWALGPLMAAVLVMNPAMGADAMSTLEGASGLSWQGRTAMLLYVALLVVALVAQFRRYRDVSNDVEQQQAKMVVAPLGLWLFALTTSLVLLALSNGEQTAWIGWIIFTTIPFGIVTPFAVAAALFRYRLFEIDRFISRTLTYGLVVGVLGLIYVFGAVWLPTRVVGDSVSPIFVAASTLAVAALFNPLRRRIQGAVDRRFNRSALRAEGVLGEFATHLRESLTAEQLVETWESTVADAIQPAAVGTWVRETSTKNSRSSRP